MIHRLRQIFLLPSVSLIRQRSMTRRCLSNSEQVQNVTPDHIVRVQCNVPRLHVSIQPQWRDSVEWTASDNLLINFNVDHGNIVLDVQAKDSHERGNITILTPEMINLDISSHQPFTLETLSKIQGDVQISCEEEAVVTMQKVRGERIHLTLPRGKLTVKKALEAQECYLVCETLHAKMLNIQQGEMQVREGCILEAVYAHHLAVRIEEGDLQVDLLKGRLNAESIQGNIKVKQVDGGLGLHAPRGKISAQINSLLASSNLLSAQKQVQVIINPEVRTSLECNSKNASVKLDISSFHSDSMSSADVTKQINGLIRGTVSTSSLSTIKSQSGKIDLAGAEWAALRRPLNPRLDNLSIENSNMEKADSSLTIHSEGDINVESLSWMDVIKRKHGFR